MTTFSNAFSTGFNLLSTTQVQALNSTFVALLTENDLSLSVTNLQALTPAEVGELSSTESNRSFRR